MVAIDNRTGKVIWRLKYPTASVIALSGSTLFVGDGEYVKALDSTDGHIMWYTMVPTAGVVSIVVKEPTLYFVTAGAGFYFSVNAGDGKKLQKIEGSYPYWNSVSYQNMMYHSCNQPKVSPISNLAITDHYAYTLCENGYIGHLDLRTGVFENIIQFEPTPERPIYSYYLAVDTTGKRLFVYLRDSAQLFAYQLIN